MRFFSNYNATQQVHLAEAHRQGKRRGTQCCARDAIQPQAQVACLPLASSQRREFVDTYTHTLEATPQPSIIASNLAFRQLARLGGPLQLVLLSKLSMLLHVTYCTNAIQGSEQAWCMRTRVHTTAHTPLHTCAPHQESEA